MKQTISLGANSQQSDLQKTFKSQERRKQSHSKKSSPKPITSDDLLNPPKKSHNKDRKMAYVGGLTPKSSTNELGLGVICENNS